MVLPIRGQAAQRVWPLATLGLIALNVLIFLLQLRLGEEATLDLFWQGGAIPAKLSQVKVFHSWQSLRLLATMFTSLFLHAGWVHLLGNLLFLWVFGEALEDELGHWRFLGFYFFCGFFSLLIHAVVASRLSVPIIGASGAIAGLLGAYLLRFPQAPVQTLFYLLVRFTIVPVPGAFELPLAALALAKTRRFSCVVALGCIIRGETPHFDYIASEAASGLQLAAIETGIPVSFGVLTCDTREQAEARVGRGGDAARTALEMADLFSHVRTRAAPAR